MLNRDRTTTADWPANPMELFEKWLSYVKAENLPEPEAMTLCSTTADGFPSARMVLLRGFDERGFRFYTNYQSRKGRELVENPRAALVFYWREPYLQVRVEGDVEKTSAEDSDAYFNSRNREKQISATISPQSSAITDYSELQAAAEKLEATDDLIPRPEHWGGFLIKPKRMEFWMGTQERMHRRCGYTLAGEVWAKELLAP